MIMYLIKFIPKVKPTLSNLVNLVWLEFKINLLLMTRERYLSHIISILSRNGIEKEKIIRITQIAVFPNREGMVLGSGIVPLEDYSELKLLLPDDVLEKVLPYESLRIFEVELNSNSEYFIERSLFDPYNFEFVQIGEFNRALISEKYRSHTVEYENNSFTRYVDRPYVIEMMESAKGKTKAAYEFIKKNNL